MFTVKFENGEPCAHPGCLSHISHPCEECGRIAGYPLPPLPGVWRQYFAQLEASLDKRLRQEYMDEDHRLGGIGITFEEFRKKALGGDDDPGSGT